MVAGSSPVSMERVVVFPAPLWPSRTVIWPSYRFRFRSLTAALPLFPTLNTCRRGRGDPGHQEPPGPSLQRPSILLPWESPSTQGCWVEIMPSAPQGQSTDGRLLPSCGSRPAPPQAPSTQRLGRTRRSRRPGIAYSKPRERPLPSWSEVKGGATAGPDSILSLHTGPWGTASVAGAWVPVRGQPQEPRKSEAQRMVPAL